MKKSSLIFLLLLAVNVAQAVKLDITTHDDLISRLETVIVNLDDRNETGKIHLRLADLYADRARLKFMEQQNTKCDNCLNPLKDRNKAIAHYEVALATADDNQKKEILLQTAHLFSMNGDLNEAEQVFNKILKNQKMYSQDLIGESYAGLGEVFFRKGQFDKARVNFEKALQYQIEKRSFVQYRLSWCLFNAGKSHEAAMLLKTILRSKEALHSSFRQDIARDLITFIAYDSISDASIKEVMSLTPAADRKANLFHLGKEADRLGNKTGALLVWQKYAGFESVDPQESLEIMIRTSQTLYDQGHYQSTVDLYKKFYEQFAKFDCDDETVVCNDLKARGRSLVHTWLKKEKTVPSPHLLSAQAIYVANNPEDIEMIQWSGHVARKINKLRDAVQFYAKAADVADKLNSDVALEGSLLLEIETAEQVNDKKLKQQAYEHYLKISKKEDNIDNVKYQLAYLSYENKDYKAAQKEFDKLAQKDSKLDTAKKIQAADLSLDSLGLLKDTTELEERSLEYAQLFPSKKLEYTTISRKAAVNDALNKKSLSKLQSVPMLGATDDEKIALYKNQIVLAEREQDIEAIDQAAQKILSIKSISADEREYALGRKLWISELKMDFKSALWFAQQMKFPNMSKADKTLKMAILTELSGLNAKSLFIQFIETTNSTEKANMIRAKLIRESSNPWKTLASYKRSLRASPKTYAATVVECYAKTQNLQELKKYIGEPAVRRNPFFSTLNRFITIDNQTAFNTKIARHRLNNSSDRALSRSFNERLALLKQAEKQARQASILRDFTLQAISLHRVQREYMRLYNDFMGLPAPRGLNAQQKVEYKKLVEQKVTPFKNIANNAQKEIATLWNQSKSLNALIDMHKKETSDMRKLAAAELRILSWFAPANYKDDVQNALQTKNSMPSKHEITSATAALKNDPFDIGKIEELKNLEEKRGRDTMVDFLEARHEQAQKKKGVL